MPISGTCPTCGQSEAESDTETSEEAPSGDPAERPSIAELRRVRSAMTPGRWYEHGGAVFAASQHNPSYDMRVMLAGAADRETEQTKINLRDRFANAVGVAAIVNSIPLLLEIAEAALAYEQAKIDAATVRVAFGGAGAVTEAAVQAIARHDADEVRRREVYRASLAKVRP